MREVAAEVLDACAKWITDTEFDIPDSDEG